MLSDVPCLCLSINCYMNNACALVPEQVATEDDAEHKYEQANAQHDDIDVERQMVQLLRRHIAV